MDQRGPEQPTPAQAMDVAKEHFRNETPANNFPDPDLGSMIKKQPTSLTAPDVNGYVKLPPSSTPTQEIHITPTTDFAEKAVTPEQDFQNNLKTIDAARAFAQGLETAGDKDGARYVSDALLQGKLAGLNNPPAMAELQSLADKAEWDRTPLLKKIAIALGSR